MPKPKNTIIIDSGNVFIAECQKPMRTLYFLAILFFGLQAIFLIMEFESTGKTYYLVTGGILAFCTGLVVSLLVFFRTFRDVIDVNEISRVKIQKVLLGNGNVYLKLKLKNKTREVFIDRDRAEEVKKELNL